MSRGTNKMKYLMSDVNIIRASCVLFLITFFALCLKLMLWLFSVVLFILPLLPISTIADDKIYDSDYKNIGSVNEDGVLYDKQFKKIGRVDSEGVLWDSSYGGKKVGRIEDDGTVYDDHVGGRKFGEWRESDGRVFDDSFRPLAQTNNKDGAGYFLNDGE